MEVRARERLIGALILVTAVVLLVPALLRGPRAPAGGDAPVPETQSVEVTLEDRAAPPVEDELVPEPEPEAAATTPLPAPAAGREEGPAERQPSARDEPVTSPVPAPTPAADPPAAQTAAWAVQLGAFSTREKAEALVADLRGRGYAAFVLEYRAGGQLLHRVRVGPEQDRARAAAVADRLRKDGFQPVVRPHP
jgi:DedD protein